jgi:uncharacterized OsmC-like protein
MAMAIQRDPASEEFPPVHVRLEQLEGYRFRVTYLDAPIAPLIVDEGAPLGSGTGPDPVLALAGAVGHCLGSTLHNTLERARVPATPIRATVTVGLGRNARGRKRVLSLTVRLECQPLDEEHRTRFDRSVEVFEDYCTVTGAVREGPRVGTSVGAPADPTVPGARA